MPRLGESIVEATIVRWRVGPGDRVRPGDIVVEIETDKATNEIPAPREGVVDRLEADEGDTLPVGSPLLRFKGEGTVDRPTQETTTSAGRPAASVSGAGSRLAPRPRDGSGRPRPCSPSVRRMARLFAIDLDTVSGTGPGGRITRGDLETRRREAPRPEAPASSGRDPGDRVVPLTGRRKRIAENLAHAQRSTVPVFALTEVDLGWVEATRAAAAARGHRLSHLPFLVQATLRAIERQPELNATLVGDEIVIHRRKNIGIAVDTEHGLVVPVLHDADRYDRDGLNERIGELAERARRRELKGADLEGGTFTLSNPGREGNLVGVSILRAPEVGILRVGAVTKRPVVRTVDGEDHLVIRPIMTAALTYDHRAVDGKTGNRFLSAFRAALEAPSD